jgi:DNA-binding NarL/FixJ family response regulator
MIRIAIADEDELLVEGLVSLLSEQKGLLPICQASTGDILLEMVLAKLPELIIIGTKLPDSDGASVTRQIKKHLPKVSIIALSLLGNSALVMDMIDAGAKGFLLKSATKSEVLEAVKTVTSGGHFFPKEIADKLITVMARGNFYPFRPSAKPKFSSRELEIISFICQQYSSKEMSIQLGINSRSIESYRQRIQQKTGARNMVGVAIYAIKNGLFSID